MTSTLRLLYVEDDHNIAKGMIRWFENRGCEVTHVASSARAVHNMRKPKEDSDPPLFDLVLTDWNLIGGDRGKDVVVEARAQNLLVRVYSGNGFDPSEHPSDMKDIWLVKSEFEGIEAFLRLVRGVP